MTGTRAEFGLLEPVLRALHARPALRPQLVVTGMHLLPAFGATVRDIRRAGWRIDASVKMQTGRDESGAQAEGVGRGVTGMVRAFDQLRTDVVVVLGDRIEVFAAATAAALTRRVVAHIHGGDRAAGDADDMLRDAVTRLAHVHLAASVQAADRLKRMGEQPWRIHRVGAPGLDGIRAYRAEESQSPHEPQHRRRALLGDLAEQRYAMVIQHPCGRPAETEARTMRAIVAALQHCGLCGVAIYPNSDPGHSGIVRVLRGLEGRAGWRVFRSLPRRDFLCVARGAVVMVGNSSSGVIESASLGLPAVNVGPRQDGRLRCGRHVVDAGETEGALVPALRRCLRSGRPRGGRSAYGDGQAGERIASVVERLIITPDLLWKHFVY